MLYRFNIDERLNMLKKDLAQALGLSGAMVSKLAKRGMPTDTLERAQRWRKRHLEPGRVKGQRMGTTAPPYTPPQTSSTGTSNGDVMRVGHLMDAAASVLDSGGDVAAMLPSIRAALRAVPESLRDEVLLNVPVMNILVGPCMRVLEKASQLAEMSGDEPTFVVVQGAMTDEDAHVMGNFWYEVAAGEMHVELGIPETESDLTATDMDEMEWPEGWDALPEP